MKRTVFVVVLAALALALLGSLALESRSVPLEVHIAQHTVATETARIRDDFQALVSSLESAWEATQSPGEGARTLIGRLAAAPEALRAPADLIPGSAAQAERIVNSFEGFSIAAAEASELASELVDDQTRYAESALFLRDVGPQIVQQMRDIRLDRVAEETFELIVGSVDFATPAPVSAAEESELRRALVTLGRDQRVDANMPREVERLTDAVGFILANRRNIQSKLSQLRDMPLPSDAAGLSSATAAAYNGTVAATDHARTLLSVYAVVLFLAVGFIAYRLQGSYRQLNQANHELAILNESLEQRVTERTEELAGTLKDLKESQVQLVQAEKMSSLGQLVAGISHEINTPLLYLANNAELLKERIDLMSRYVQTSIDAFSLNPDEFDDRSAFQAKLAASLKALKKMLRSDDVETNLQEAQDLVADSIDGLSDLTEMAQSLKDFSRLDRAPVGSFDVNAGMDKTLVIARNIVKHKAEVRKFYGDVPEIECSPSQINQVFLNLITNAAQAIETHGEIVVATKLYDDEHVAISVSDTGCGIPDENLDKIRDPFFTTKEVGAGTGLGLSIVDEIIRGHGGRLLVESQVDRGSTFTVVLPIARDAAAAADLEPEPDARADLGPTSKSGADLAEAV